MSREIKEIDVYTCDLCGRTFSQIGKLRYGVIDEVIKPKTEPNDSDNIMLTDVEDMVHSEGHSHICIYCRVTICLSIMGEAMPGSKCFFHSEVERKVTEYLKDMLFGEV